MGESDDEVVGGWRIDDATRVQLRLDRVKKALDQGDWGGAVLEAEELLDEAPKHAEGLFLLGEALLELGDAQGAVDAYEQHLETAQAAGGGDAAMRAGALAGLAVARFECADLAGSVEAGREAVRMAPDLAETHFYLGLALERLPGRKSEAMSEFVAANQLDAEAYPFPARLDAKQWQALFAEALNMVSDDLRAFWGNIPVVFSEWPPLDELRAVDPPITPTVSGLYSGIPPEEEDPWTVKPTGLRLFTGNLARSGDRDGIIEEIARTLMHEAMDWVGETEDDVDEDDEE